MVGYANHCRNSYRSLLLKDTHPSFRRTQLCLHRPSIHSSYPLIEVVVFVHDLTLGAPEILEQRCVVVRNDQVGAIAVFTHSDSQHPQVSLQ